MAISLFHAVFSNLAGIAVTPALIFLYLGADGAAVGSAGAAAGKLASQVLGPVLVGMAIRSAPSFAASLGSKPVKSKLKLASDGIIYAIIYNTFCNTFKGGFGVATGEVSALFAILAALLVAYKASIFFAANAVGLARRGARRGGVHGLPEDPRVRSAAHQSAVRGEPGSGVAVPPRAGVPSHADRARQRAGASASIVGERRGVGGRGRRGSRRGSAGKSQE